MSDCEEQVAETRRLCEAANAALKVAEEAAGKLVDAKDAARKAIEAIVAWNAEMGGGPTPAPPVPRLSGAMALPPPIGGRIHHRHHHPTRIDAVI